MRTKLIKIIAQMNWLFAKVMFYLLTQHKEKDMTSLEKLLELATALLAKLQEIQLLVSQGVITQEQVISNLQPLLDKADEILDGQ